MHTNERAFLARFLEEGVYLIDEPSAKPPAEPESEPETASEPVAPAEAAPPPALRYFGGNWKRVAVVVDEPGDVRERPYYPFLLKVLSAVQLDEQSVALVNLREQPDGLTVDFETVRAELQPKSWLLFGVPPAFLPIRTKPYEPAEHAGVSLLQADSLQDIEREVSRKRLLWGALQRLFLSE